MLGKHVQIFCHLADKQCLDIIWISQHTDLVKAGNPGRLAAC